jgi:hypothetical protein
VSLWEVWLDGKRLGIIVEKKLRGARYWGRIGALAR